MRAARGVYANAIRAQLHSIGIDDLPRNGAFILAGIDTTGGPRQDLPSDLGVTKQAVSQVIEILVNRGYVNRSPDPGDRRRIILELTERGQEVVGAVLRGVQAVDLQLHERVSADQVDAMRSALLALADIKSASITTGAGRRRPARQFRSFSPIFPVRNLTAALAHYAALGFDTLAYADGTSTGSPTATASDCTSRPTPATILPTTPPRPTCYVRDADALYEEWSRPGIGGLTRPVGPTPYRLREGSHTDPDGNLIRFGSPMAEHPGGE